MMSRRWMLLVFVLAAIFSLGLAACGDDEEPEGTVGDTVEDAGDTAGEAAEDAGDTAEDAGDTAGEALDEAADEVDEALDEAGDSIGVVAGDPDAGATVFTEQGCDGCHSLDPAAAAMTGPPLHNIGTVAEERTDQSAPEYIRESIVDPGAYVVEGYENVMPPFELPDDQLDNLVAYLLAQTE